MLWGRVDWACRDLALRDKTLLLTYMFIIGIIFATKLLDNMPVLAYY